MANRSMNIDRFDGVAGNEVDRVQHLTEFQQIVKSGPITYVAHTIEADDVRRAGDAPVGHPIAADVEVLLRVPAVQHELSRSRGDALEDHLLRETHVQPRFVDIGTRFAEQTARLAVPDIHPDPFENRQRCVVDRFELVSRDDLGVVETHARLLPRALQWHGAARAGIAAASAPGRVVAHRARLASRNIPSTVVPVMAPLSGDIWQ